MTQAPVFFLLNELNLPALLLHAALRHPVYLIDVVPIFARSRPLLDRAARRLMAAGRLCDAYAERDEVKHIINRPAYCDFTDIFQKIDAWVGEHFRFGAAEATASPYLLPYQHTSWNEVWVQADHAISIVSILRGADGDRARFYGVNRNLAGICGAYAGRAPRPSAFDVPLGRRLFNLLQGVGIFAYIAVWSTLRTRLALPAQRSYLLGSTYANMDYRLFSNLQDIADDRADVCMVFYREQHLRNSQTHLDIDGYNWCMLKDARLTPVTLLSSLALAGRDLASLYLQFGGARHTQFLNLAKLVWHRVAYRNLFRTRRFRYFWGRDEYNADHMIRSQELRRIGGCSIGTHHGIGTTQIVCPLRWYQDFDVLFVFGRHYYETYCSAVLPAHMEIIPMGAFGLNRDQLAGIADPRSSDIVVFTNISLENQSFVTTTLALAAAFPDRTIYFKCKGGYEAPFAEFLGGTPPAPANVVICDTRSETSYRLMTTCGYAVSAHSTAGIEALYYGVKTFVLDNQPDDYPLYFRDFEDLCFRDPQVLIDRIRAIEAGEADYPWQRYAGLVDMTNRNPFDIVRERMGLAPKDDDGTVPGLVASRRPGAAARRKRT